MFQGSIVALITPFRQGQLDEAALARLVEWHIEQGTHGIVPVGTTGESPTLTHDEHCRVVELVVKLVAFEGWLVKLWRKDWQRSLGVPARKPKGPG